MTKTGFIKRSRDEALLVSIAEPLNGRQFNQLAISNAELDFSRGRRNAVRGGNR